MNTAVHWSPTAEDEFVLLDMQFFGEKFGIHTMHVDVSENDVTNLSNVLAVEDGAPNWSADGDWVTFGRKRSGINMGWQLWMMRPDGSDARQLTEQNNLHHGVPQWSADGLSIMYQQFDLDNTQGFPGIWVYDIPSGQTREIMTPATQPQWIP